ncbi:MAG: class I SAM-dependent methyltransferase [Acidobacteria bacterium]|nr:class I SAM-dependent methyltransferase [Acidobacteriota bacterium]
MRFGSIRRRLAGYLLGLGGRPEEHPIPPDYLSPAELKGTLDDKQMRQKAEDYFSSIADWNDLLRKPFSRIEDTPPLLINLAVLIRGMNLVPGMKVLDFAAGSCWATDVFLRLGCHVVSIDVSMTGLRIGRSLIERDSFRRAAQIPAVFDGERLPLADSSIDRIFCFDAFHHVLRQREVLGEMHRVLVGGGIAAFGEPGPHHSRSAQSQSEMKTYRVLEDDLDLRKLSEMASDAGFVTMNVSLFNADPSSVPLDQFEEFLEGGPACVDYVDQSRQFLSNARDFFLQKAGRERADSRRPAGLRAEIEVALDEVRSDGSIPFSFRVKNSGEAHWLPSSEPVGGVSLGCHLYDAERKLISWDFHWESLEADGDRSGVAPGAVVEGRGIVPRLAPGDYILELDLVSNGVIWFTQKGSPTVSLPVSIPGS